MRVDIYYRFIEKDGAMEKDEDLQVLKIRRNTKLLHENGVLPALEA